MMRTRFLIDMWFVFALLGLGLFYFSLFRSFSGEVTESGLSSLEAVIIIIGISFSIYMACKVINHRKNIVLWVLVQLGMWLGGLLFFYPFVTRKTIK